MKWFLRLFEEYNKACWQAANSDFTIAILNKDINRLKNEINICKSVIRQCKTTLSYCIDKSVTVNPDLLVDTYNQCKIVLGKTNGED